MYSVKRLKDDTLVTDDYIIHDEYVIDQFDSAFWHVNDFAEGLNEQLKAVGLNAI
jgi:hypothetical protein